MLPTIRTIIVIRAQFFRSSNPMDAANMTSEPTRNSPTKILKFPSISLNTHGVSAGMVFMARSKSGPLNSTWTMMF